MGTLGGGGTKIMGVSPVMVQHMERHSLNKGQLY